MDRRLFLVFGLSLIVALVILVGVLLPGGRPSRHPKDTNVKEVVIAAKPLDVGVTIKPEDVKAAEGLS